MNLRLFAKLSRSMLAALALLGMTRAWAIDPPLTLTGVAASGSDVNVPANAIDGILTTRWSAKGVGQWIRVDLGAPQLISSVGIAWYRAPFRQFTFEIQVSGDLTTWTRVFSGKSALIKTEEIYDVADSIARYVRVVCNGNTYDTWNSICELRVFGTVPPPVEVEIVPVSVTATSNDGNLPINTLDGSLATRWSALGDGQSITYDLGARRRATSMDIAWHKGNERTAMFEVHSSLDGSQFAPVFIGVSSGTTTNLETVDLPDTDARFLRVVGYGNSLNEWNSITEVEIYGLTSTNSSGTSTNSTGTVTNTPGTGSLPSKILNLTNWKLTLPVDTAHEGSPDEYEQPELAGFSIDPYFKVNGASNGVVFRAHCGGATTSGSGYPRSELREMTANGTTKASWSTSSGTHTMEITQAITAIPPVKNHVVAGQIHDANDDVIVFRLEGSHLFIDLNGATGPTLTSTYQLGTIFTVKFVASGGKIDCYYNGKFIYSYVKAATGCYFKAGCYTQSNTSKGDLPTSYGEVVIYGLSVTHQ